jgi:hypothetical protein
MGSRTFLGVPRRHDDGDLHPIFTHFLTASLPHGATLVALKGSRNLGGTACRHPTHGNHREAVEPPQGDVILVMYKEQILSRAIDRASANGWPGAAATSSPKTVSCGNAGLTASLNHRIRNYRALLFSQDFAKAFWGEKNEPTCDGDCRHCGQLLDLGVFWTIVPCWQYALHQMVLEDDPIKYLERFLEPEEHAVINGVDLG